MQQLSGQDAAFVYFETQNVPMHIGSLAIYDQSTAPGGRVGFKDILAYFSARMHKSRCFRQRLATVPLGLDHPYWVEDQDFDIEFHIRHIALPHPGDWRQLCIQAARLHARPLDITRPLWEFYIIEGLDRIDGIPPGSFALLSKFHHAAIDGVSGAEIAAAMHDLAPEAPHEGEPSPWQPERAPGQVELLARSGLSAARLPLHLARLTGAVTPALMKVGKRALTGGGRPHLTAPRTRFNTNVSPHRVFDGRSFKLADIKEIRAAVPGATVNDAVVAIIGGAMRAYLVDKGELPEESLVAMAPVSARQPAEAKAAGNRVSAMRLPIGSHIGDPLKRLEFVRQQSLGAKEMVADFGLNLGNEAAELLPSTLSGLAARVWARSHLADRVPPLFNTIITNVPGAGIPLYSMGSRLVANFGLGPIVHGCGLFQPVLSYDGTITLSAVSCREMMPDPAFYCECLEASFEALQDAARAVAVVADGRAEEKPSGKPRRRNTARRRKAAG
ncbi:MAG: wax ester/triacylglycerol synthase family O-acyltransferase [Pseudomonadota bacterium]